VNSNSQKIKRIFKKVLATNMLLLIGDFNARVGEPQHQTNGDVVDPVNDNGQGLINFCSSNNLVITHIFFSRKSIHSMTAKISVSIERLQARSALITISSEQSSNTTSSAERSLTKNNLFVSTKKVYANMILSKISKPNYVNGENGQLLRKQSMENISNLSYMSTRQLHKTKEVTFERDSQWHQKESQNLLRLAISSSYQY
jgi:hypothetical protein